MSTPTMTPDAERAVLCVAFLDGGVHAPEVVAAVPADAYERLAHRHLAEAVAAIVGRGAAVDPVTVAAELTARGSVDAVGGMEYVGALVDEVPDAAHLSDHAELVRAAAARRALKDRAARLVAAAEDPKIASRELQADAELLARTLGTDLPRNQFSPPTIEQFAAEAGADVRWVVPGYLARGGVTLLAGHPKTGKTTLAAAIVNAVARGRPVLGQQATLGSVLWIDLEQPKGLTKRRITEACGTDAAVYVQWGAWPDLAAVARWCRAPMVEAGLVVIDSLTKIWEHYGVEDENDAAQVDRALQPLLRFAREADVALLTIGHLRKSGGAEGLDLRGSGQIFAAVDVGLAFRRFTTDGELADQRRVLEAFSRFEETPAKVVLDRVAGEYRVAGTPEQVRRSAEREKVLAVMTAEPRTAEDIAVAAEFAASTARTVLKALHAQPDSPVEREGSGKRGDPFRYALKRLRGNSFSSGAQLIGNPESPQIKLVDTAVGVL